MQATEADKRHSSAATEVEQLQAELAVMRTKLHENDMQHAAEVGGLHKDMQEVTLSAQAATRQQVEQGLQALRWELQTAKVTHLNMPEMSGMHGATII